MREVTMSTTVLAELLDVTDAATAWGRWDWVLLNPQPLPPREVFPPREGFAPGPPPRYWTHLTRAVIARHLDRIEQAGIIIVSGDLDHVLRRVAHDLESFTARLLDGTPPNISPEGLWQPESDAGAPHPVDLVLAGLQFQHAADALPEHPLHHVLEGSASQLVDVGLARTGGS